ncbi:MAG: DUF3224 domain-containing protein [Myxococcales bacterium]|nr:DUF3224 domain-containing protein [Myxococcales bacterium]
MSTAQGTFDVTMRAEPPYSDRDGVTLARATFDKTFHGPLAATSEVQFLSVRAGEHAAYVALERIDGTLEGRAGSFVVTHLARASKEAKTLSIEIVAGTGTGDLVGIEGTMEIQIVEKQHRYTVTYTLP